jgi:hypothetical protein
MAFQFVKKPQQQPAQTTQEKSPAEIKAERLRIAREAAEIARRRRERIAAVQAGRLSRQELDASERILLESYERKEETEQRPGFFEKLASRVAGTGLGVLIGSIITATAAQPNSCNGVTNPFLWRLAGVLGGLGAVVLVIAAAVWLFRQLFL